MAGVANAPDSWFISKVKGYTVARTINIFLVSVAILPLGCHSPEADTPPILVASVQEDDVTVTLHRHLKPPANYKVVVRCDGKTFSLPDTRIGRYFENGKLRLTILGDVIVVWRRDAPIYLDGIPAAKGETWTSKAVSAQLLLLIDVIDRRRVVANTEFAIRIASQLTSEEALEVNSDVYSLELSHVLTRLDANDFAQLPSLKTLYVPPEYEHRDCIPLTLDVGLSDVD